MLVQNVILAALGLLASPVSAGSRHWEAGTPLIGRGNGTHALHRRAISFQPSGGQNGHYPWPDKTIRYCYADATAKERLEGFVEGAKDLWGQLKDYDFKYEEVDLKTCDKDRINVLKIHYNDQGKLSSSVGKTPIDDEYNRNNPDNQVLGPTMHLSTRDDVGMLDPVANVAHEFGHAWGLYHEQQNPNLWHTTFEEQSGLDPTQPRWNMFPGTDPTFAPSQFHCQALRDYDQALVEARRLQAENPNLNAGLEISMCSSVSDARRVKFSALEYLPYYGTPIIADKEFDPRSIMLYPSGAGGRAGANTPDTRADVLTLANGVRILPNVRPSDRDIDRLRVLYSTNIADIKELHIRGAKKSTFDKIRKGMKKFGSAKDKSC